MNLRPADHEWAQLAEFQRRQKISLVCLVIAEVANTASLKEAVGEDGVSRLLQQHDQALRDLLREYSGGLEIRADGPVFLLAFDKPSDAVRFAIALQDRTRRLGSRLGHRMAERVGVHFGEVLVEAPAADQPPRLNGLQVEVAHAVQSLAGSGRTLLTRFAYDNVREAIRSLPGSPALQGRSLGLYELPGRGDPVEVCEVGDGLSEFTGPPTGNERIRRLADQPDPEPVTGAGAFGRWWGQLWRPSGRLGRAAAMGAGLTALVGGTVLLTGLLDGLSYDGSYWFRPVETPPEVVIVEMDQPSHLELNQDHARKWDRRLHARLLETLHVAGARAVAFDVLFDNLTTPAADNSLRTALRECGPVVLGAGIVANSLGAPRILAPEPSLRDSARWGIVEWSGRSRTLRQPAGGFQGYPSMSELLVELTAGHRPEIPRGAWLKYYGPPGTLSHRSFAAVLSNEVPSVVFSNKVVFIGANAALPTTVDSGTDYFRSPYSLWQLAPIPGVEVNATSFVNLVRNDWLFRLSPWMELVLTLGFGGVLGYLLCFLEPARAVVVGLVVAGVGGLAGMTQVWMSSVWFPWLVFSGVQMPVAVGWAIVSRTRRVAEEDRELRSLLRQRRALTTASFHAAAPLAMKTSSPGVPDIPNHEMVRRIGKGAYGEVWLARDVLGGFHAVKVIQRSSFTNAGPFDREFRGLQKYTPVSRSHPGLVHILHVGRDDAVGFIFYIMEVADDVDTGGGVDPDTYSPRSLASDLARQGPLSPQQVAQWGREIGEALAFLHRRGLVHRDLKPANIIFVHERPKLADIGLVTDIAGPGCEVTHLGTPGYIPPEGPGAPAADVYGLGRLLYVALTGNPANEFPDLPETVKGAWPVEDLEQVMEILLRACEPIVKERYPTVEALLGALGECRFAADRSRGSHRKDLNE